MPAAQEKTEEEYRVIRSCQVSDRYIRDVSNCLSRLNFLAAEFINDIYGSRINCIGFNRADPDWRGFYFFDYR